MKQISLRLPDDLVEAVERERGQVPRERWIRGLIAERVASGFVVPAPAVRAAIVAEVPGPLVGRPADLARVKASYRPHQPQCRCPVCKPPKGSS